ncbi:MAG: hypothetical protein AB7F75_04190 [Planctomycetota bacterium]
MFQRTLALALTLSLLIHVPLRAEWPEAFQKQVEADYEGIPLRKALEELRDDTGAPMNIHSSLDLNQKVNLVVKLAPARDIIAMLCEQLDMDYTFQNGIILLTSKSTKDDIIKRDFMTRSVVKIYNVVDLIGELRDFRGPDISLSGGEEGGGIAIEEADNESDAPFTGDGIVEFIKVYLNRLDDVDGFFVEIRNGSIHVRTVPEEHDKIAQLFKEMRQGRFRMVEVITRVYRGTIDDINTLQTKVDGLALNADGETQLSQLEVVDSVRNLGFSTQRVNGTSLKQQAYIRDYTAVVNADVGMMDPDIGYLQLGITSDIRANPSEDGSRVLLDARVTFSYLQGMSEEDLSDSHKESHDKGVTEGATHRKVGLPAVDLVSARGSYRIPTQKWIPVATGVDRVAKSEYVILVKARVIEN